MLTLYLMDFSFWTSLPARIVRGICLVLVACMCVLLVLLRARSTPHGLILLYTMGTVAWFISMKHLFFNKVIFRDYVSWIAGPMFAASICTLGVWIHWIQLSTDNSWSPERKVQYAKEFKWDSELTEGDYLNKEDCRRKVGAGAGAVYAKDPYSTCMPDSKEGSKSYFNNIKDSSEYCPTYCAQLYDSCTVSFMVWATPFIVALVMLFLSFICAFLNPQSSAQAPTTFGKIFCILIFGLWCTASLSGAGQGINESFATFFIGASVSIAMIIVATFGVPNNTEDLHNLETFKNIKKKYGWMADFMKATLISTSSPIIAVYMALSAINQTIRRLGVFPFSVKLNKSEGEDKMWITRNAKAQVVEFKRWDHAKVYSWAIIIGITYMAMQVIAAKFTVLFLSWMKVEFARVSFVMVTLIIMLVGMTLFLLPPIPGVPIYLTGGLMIPAVATGIGTQDDGSNGPAQFPGGIPGAVAYTCIVSTFLKLAACTLQQKAIGEPLGHKVWIRQLVSVNSDAIRTMKLVLQQPGLSVAKVAILIGGPDWPTSVFCGIMHLPLHQILLGTLPVFFLIVPTVLAGTFLWMSLLMDPVTKQPIYDWAVTVSTIFMLLAAAVQSGSMVVAAYHLERAVSTRGDELKAIPIDQEVLDADRRNITRNLLYVQITQWDKVPYFWKKVLHFGVFCQVCSCYITMTFTYSSPYSLTNKPSDLPGGHWYNLLTVYGWISMLFFCLALLCWYFFRSWAYRQVTVYQKSGKPLPTEESVMDDPNHLDHYSGIDLSPGGAAADDAGSSSADEVETGKVNLSNVAKNKIVPAESVNISDGNENENENENDDDKENDT